MARCDSPQLSIVLTLNPRNNKLDISVLSVIHVTGTKGKGSTCALAESVLRNHGFTTGDLFSPLTLPQPTCQTHYNLGMKRFTVLGVVISVSPQLVHPPVPWSGLFTSPHLLEVTERIRVNGKPLTTEAFTKYFFEVWDRLQATRGGQSTPTETNSTGKGEGGGGRGVDSPADMPTFFHLITLVRHQGGRFSQSITRRVRQQQYDWLGYRTGEDRIGGALRIPFKMHSSHICTLSFYSSDRWDCGAL